MGGNALNLKTERKTTEQFNKIFSEIEPILKELGITYFLTKCYRNKETHGDMDILIKNENLNKELLTKIIIDKFNPQSIAPNDKTISFDYDNFQIDFILIDYDKWDFANDWYSYDCYGNCCGKLAHRFGLKYGPNGLIFPFRGENETLVQDILISTDSEKTFKFFDYDYNKFKNGFDELEEIFDYIISSKYFSHDVYKYENLNRIDRKRNKRRKSYNQFLSYLEDNGINKFYNFKEKNLYIKEINEFFPESNLIDKIQELNKLDIINKEIKDKFNGKIIMSIYPELKGKELGYYIQNFKLSKDNFNEFILNNTSDKIIEDFNIFYKNGNK